MVLQVSLYTCGYELGLTLLLSNLGIDDYYFVLESVETIANHVMSLYGAKMLAYTRNENALDVKLEKEEDDSSVYIHSSKPGVTESQGPLYEKK